MNPAARSSGQEHAGTPDPRMLEMLVCPLTRTTLEYDAAKDELVSKAARLAFPVRHGVPIMLPSEARQLGDEETASD